MIKKEIKKELKLQKHLFNEFDALPVHARKQVVYLDGGESGEVPLPVLQGRDARPRFFRGGACLSHGSIFSLLLLSLFMFLYMLLQLCDL